MESKQLRIGNLLHYDNYPVTVISIHENMFEVHSDIFQFWQVEPDDELISGIPLTTEWVEKFGFKDVTEHFFYPTFRKDYTPVMVKQIFEIQQLDNDMWVWLVGNTNVHIYKVHHLQNLYNSVAREELNIA